MFVHALVSLKSPCSHGAGSLKLSSQQIDTADEDVNEIIRHVIAENVSVY